MSETPVRSKQRRTRGKPTHVDVHVGKRVRERRSLLGFSQEKLGNSLDLTFQQVQKYERGANRVGAGRLYQLAQALEVPVNYFFEELPEGDGSDAVSSANSETTKDDASSDPLSRRETLTLVRAYYGIEDASVRRRVLDLVRSMGPSEQPKAD
jgi:transcriptional regulator with XRE-family HTH domain